MLGRTTGFCSILYNAKNIKTKEALNLECIVQFKPHGLDPTNRNKCVRTAKNTPRGTSGWDGKQKETFWFLAEIAF